MTSTLSQIVETNQLSTLAESVPVVRAYGDGDDPLRLTVLLADRLVTTESSEFAEQCKDPKATWRRRSGSLRDLLRASRKKLENGNHYIAFIDPDALFPSTQRDWEDAPAHTIRVQFFDIIRDAIAEGGWLVVRPWPTTHVTEQLFDASLEPAPTSASTHVEDFFMPDCRPTVRWLIEHGTLTDADVTRIVTTVRDPNDHIVGVAYDVLRTATRAAARRISATRAPSHANGTFGDLPWADTTISRSAFVELRDAGFLQSDDYGSPNEIRLTRRARALLTRHAVLEADSVRGIHTQLANIAEFKSQSTEKKLEVHYHAVQAGDVDLAKGTALYYGTELRHVATHLSREKKAYAEAANLFRYILDNFDGTDGYAWEYFGYNLARSDAETHESGKHEKEILEAYAQAHGLSPQNPLYEGRWLGYRAERGQNVASQIERALAHYLDRSEAWDAADLVSLFIRPALDGMRRGKQTTERHKIIQKWRTRLESVGPQVLASLKV